MPSHGTYTNYSSFYGMGKPICAYSLVNVMRVYELWRLESDFLKIGLGYRGAAALDSMAAKR